MTRLRFRGRAATLNAMCRAFHDRPKQSLSAGDVAEATELDFRNVHQRLAETPELFIHLRKKKGEATRYRLASNIEPMSAAETASFIDAQERIETRLVAIVVGVFTVLAVIVGLLSRFD